MANGSDRETGALHPSIWATAIAAGGFLLGVGGAVLWIGGSLRQIDINSHRLDTLEQFGSPIVQAIKADLQSVRVTISELSRQSEKTNEIILERGKALATIDEAIKQMGADIRVLEEFSRQTAERRAQLATQVAASDGRIIALERDLVELRGSLRRLRDEVKDHDKQDQRNLRDELNAIRNKHSATEQPPKS